MPRSPRRGLQHQGLAYPANAFAGPLRWVTNRFEHHGLLRGALLVTGSTYLSYGLGLLASILVARALGPADYGRYAYVMWMSALLVQFINHGLTTTAIRFTSEWVGRGDPAAAARLQHWLWRQHWRSAAMVAAAFLPLVPWLEPEGWRQGLPVFAAVVLATAVTRATNILQLSLAKGHGLFALEAVTSSVVSVAALSGAAAAFACKAPMAVYLALFLLVNLLPPLISQRGLGRAGLRAEAGELAPAQRALIRSHLRWTLVLVVSFTLSNKAIETALLNRLWSAESVAFFSIAGALTRGGIEMLSAGFATVLMPSMAHAFGHEGLPRVQRITETAVRALQLLGLSLAGAGWFWARPMVLGLYGPKYLPAVPALQVMLAVGGFGLAHGALGALLSTTNHQSARALVAFASLSIGAACALALVPPFGLAGALASHAVGSLTLLGVTAAVVHRKLRVRLPWHDLGRLVLAATVGAGAGACCALAWPTSAGELAAGLVFLVVYLGMTLPLRFWRRNDAALLAGLPLPAAVRRHLAALASA